MITVFPDIKALIFDLDGTLADTMTIHYQAWHDTFAAFGVSCPQSFLESHNGTPTEGIVEHFNVAFGHRIDSKLFAQAKENRVKDRLLQAKPIEPVAEIAQQYRGRLPMAVATGSRLAIAQTMLRAIGMLNHFDALVSADDPVEPKPAPDIFLEAARRLGVEARYCQVFEDADHGLEGARRAGMRAVDIRPLLKKP
ncbi:MAG: HAD-IA family hydrolase [Candidatus Competibacteraceae bacterium]|nr:HAD-IA family hydrolase [Candidatus Competibacteraceae bacterium]